MSSSDKENKAQTLGTFMMLKGTDVDVFIGEMYAKVYPDDTGNRSVREMQQRISTYITRFNRSHDFIEIVPGSLKQSYCIRTKATA